MIPAQQEQLRHATNRVMWSLQNYVPKELSIVFSVMISPFNMIALLSRMHWFKRGRGRGSLLRVFINRRCVPFPHNFSRANKVPTVQGWLCGELPVAGRAGT
jgi:hypothetical protein